MEDNTLEIDNIVAEELLIDAPQTEVTGGAHDDFNWAAGKKAGKAYTADERKALEASYDNTMTALSEGKVVYATVNRIPG